MPEDTRGPGRARIAGPMVDHATETRERDRWRARILRALAELRREALRGEGVRSREHAASRAQDGRTPPRR
jgi:hypothetical protein